MTRLGSLCTGFGGLDLAAETILGPLGHAWHAELDPAASQVLAHHWPDVPNLGDLTQVDWTRVEPVDVLTAGFPCQDVSVAGRRAGLKPGTRTGVWTHIATAIDTLRPPLVLLENVEGLLSAPADSDVEPCPWCLGDTRPDLVVRALGAVLADLAQLGFDAEWATVPASDVGAPHRRRRVFILAWPADTAHAQGEGPQGPRSEPARRGPERSSGPAESLTLLPTPAAARSGRQKSASPGATVRPSLDSITHLLPTPRTNDARGAGHHGTGGPDLRTAVSLLPTPDAHMGTGGRTRSADAIAGGRRQLNLNDLPRLLPTPRATDGTKGGPNQRGSSGDLMLPSAVIQLLPTPTVANSRGSRNATANRTNPLPTTTTTSWTLCDVTHANRWGTYAPAIARWETVTGRPAPDPTETGTRGQPRLSPRFVEWLMGLPAGWVTDHLPRNAALKCLGNGVVPQQAAWAYADLITAAGATR